MSSFSLSNAERVRRALIDIKENQGLTEAEMAGAFSLYLRDLAEEGGVTTADKAEAASMACIRLAEHLTS